MSEIHYFPRYSQPENVVTNNTLLLLLRLHQYNGFKFEKFIDLICGDQEVQFASFLASIPPTEGNGEKRCGWVYRPGSIKIAVETKLTEAFDPAPLENHLAVFGAEQHKLLILLSPSLGEISSSQLDLVRERAISRNIQVVHTSFEDIVRKNL